MAENSYKLEGHVVTTNIPTDFGNSNSDRVYEKLGENTFAIGTTYNNVVHSSDAISLFTLDMAQSSFFTLEIEGLTELEPAMYHSATGPNSKKADGYKRFLPIKSLDYTPVSMENKNFNAGIFQDLFIIEKRKLGMLNITLLDTSDNIYEYAVTDWFSLPTNNTVQIKEDGSNKNKLEVYHGYVGFLVDWAKVCRYNEYTVRGEKSKSYEFMVLPTGDVKISRAYDNNQLKEISFSVIIGSDITLL